MQLMGKPSVPYTILALVETKHRDIRYSAKVSDMTHIGISILQMPDRLWITRSAVFWIGIGTMAYCILGPSRIVTPVSPSAPGWSVDLEILPSACIVIGTGIHRRPRPETRETASKYSRIPDFGWGRTFKFKVQGVLPGLLA